MMPWIYLDSLLIQLRSHVTPMWKEFGLVIGIYEEFLDRCSSYPSKECLQLVEVHAGLLAQEVPHVHTGTAEKN